MPAEYSDTRRTFLAACFLTGATLVTSSSLGLARTAERRSDMTLTVQEISDRMEIDQVLARYCYAFPEAGASLIGRR